MTEDLYIIYEKEQVQIINSVPHPEIIKQVDSISAQAVANEPVRDPRELIEMPVTSEKTREFNYLGENNKYFLILFNDTYFIHFFRFGLPSTFLGGGGCHIRLIDFVPEFRCEEAQGSINLSGKGIRDSRCTATPWRCGGWIHDDCVSVMCVCVLANGGR
jgi:hypothetical protein